LSRRCSARSSGRLLGGDPHVVAHLTTEREMAVDDVLRDLEELVARISRDGRSRSLATPSAREDATARQKTTEDGLGGVAAAKGEKAASGQIWGLWCRVGRRGAAQRASQQSATDARPRRLRVCYEREVEEPIRPPQRAAAPWRSNAH
jgi:hypothetical protein